MKVTHVYKFDVGIIEIPNQAPVNGVGYFPLVTHTHEPWEHVPSESVTNQVVAEIKDWLLSVGLTKESHVAEL